MEIKLTNIFINNWIIQLHISLFRSELFCYFKLNKGESDPSNCPPPKKKRKYSCQLWWFDWNEKAKVVLRKLSWSRLRTEQSVSWPVVALGSSPALQLYCLSLPHCLPRTIILQQNAKLDLDCKLKITGTCNQLSHSNIFRISYWSLKDSFWLKFMSIKFT